MKVLFECKYCHAKLTVEDSQRVVLCNYCGTEQALPCGLALPDRASQFERANHHRQNGDFDRAMEIYNKILDKNADDAEVYWSLLLCRFGVVYVKDAGGYKPTINRMQRTSILADEDYRAACKHADAEQREIYMREAGKINDIQRRYLQIVESERPFDVFICFKDEPKGKAFGQDFYNLLTSRGYRVFFSAATLKSLAGEEYEPYIYAALQSARVMIVIATGAENVNSPWVKNEWQRFLLLMREDKGRLLIPAVSGMRPEELPADFSHLEAVSLNEMTGAAILLERTNATVHKEEQQVALPEVVRGNIELEDGEWAVAQRWFEQALNANPRSGEAYLGLFLIGQQCTDLDALAQKLTQPAGDAELREACAAASEWIRQVAGRYPEMDGQAIEALFAFDRTYKSAASAWERAIARAEQAFSDLKFVRAKRFAPEMKKRELENAEARVLDALEKRVDSERLADEARSKGVRAAYRAHLEAAAKKAAEWAEQQRRQQPVLDKQRFREFYDSNRDGVEKVAFVRMSEVNVPANRRDISAAQDGSVQAWIAEKTLYVAAQKPVQAPEDASGLFKEFAVQEISLNGNLDTSKTVSMREMFCDCKQLKKVDVEWLNTGNVTDMFSMFADCSLLTELDVRRFDTGKVENLRSMFFQCTALTKLDVSRFDTRSATTMYQMFVGCSSLTELNVSGFNTRNVTDMGFMFGSCPLLTSIDVSGFDTRNVTDMRGMFSECSSLNTVDVSRFVTRNVTNMRDMFYKCPLLKEIDVSKFDTYNVADMSGMFNECTSLTAIDVSGFDTHNVTDMFGMFGECSALMEIDVSGFYTRNVTNMRGMFYGCALLTTIDVSGFDTCNVTDMCSMFDGCTSLAEIDVSSFDTRNVTNMDSMFSSCMKLRSIDVSNFNTRKVTNMRAMFAFCLSLRSLSIRNFDTRNVTDMGGMFLSCRELKDLEIGRFDTRNVTDMIAMFYNCNALKRLEIDRFDTRKVKTFQSMFFNCPCVTRRDVAHFDTSSASDADKMFDDWPKKN
ncbi:MAG: BspA family leucine-rich repeat surface protein [Candidatus Faecivicinus sp.]|nr:BspA family leucine-rich repeat surface protein [Candidatus Faecivicinus sp.]